MNKMLLVGFVCLSLGAFAQQSQSSREQKSAPRDAASGMPTGKRMHKPLTMRDQASGQATGKSAAAATGQSEASSNGSSSTTSAIGTGKRQHRPITVTKEMDKASVKMVTKQPNGSSPKTVVVHKEMDASTPK